MNNNNSKNEKSITPIWVAVIGALAVVIAAYISKGAEKKEASPTTTTPITITNTQNNNNATPPPVDTNNLPSINVKADNHSKVYINKNGKQTINEGN